MSGNGVRLCSLRWLRVVVAVVLGQNVAAEVTAEVAPYAVDVIRPALGVVKLDEVAWRLDAIVVPLPGLEPAHPEELDRRQAGGADAGGGAAPGRPPESERRYRSRAD